MAELQLQGLRRTYANGVTAVDGIDLAVRDGEFMVLVGPSGCGKSTTLRMIAGPEDITAGKLIIDMSTLRPDTMQALGTAVARKGGAFVESPVGGSTAPAKEGKLFALVGGEILVSPGGTGRPDDPHGDPGGCIRGRHGDGVGDLLVGVRVRHVRPSYRPSAAATSSRW